LLNASRGEVIASDALRGLSRERLALDVYPQEPSVDPQWVTGALFSTPHVAGGTHEAKWTATDTLLRQLSLPGLPKRERNLISEPITIAGGLDEDLVRVEKGVGDVLAAGTGLMACVQRWQEAMGETLSAPERAALFEDHRRKARREPLQGLPVFVDASVGGRESWVARLAAHGISLCTREDAAIYVEDAKIPS
jgi:hypothetical protein